jgi:hypothetical protein
VEDEELMPENGRERMDIKVGGIEPSSRDSRRVLANVLLRGVGEMMLKLGWVGEGASVETSRAG